MKKTYISPLVEEVTIEHESMLLNTSPFPFFPNDEVSSSGQLSNGSRGPWNSF